MELSSERLNHLRCSNNPPLHNEIPLLEKSLSVQRDHVARLRTELALLPVDAHDGDLELLRRTESATRKHAAILSVVRWLPAELICEIMAQTCPHTKSIGEQTPIPQPPWWLGHICRRWRAVAHAYPPLWTSIGLYASYTSDMDRVCSSEALTAQLHLTGQQTPLDITLIWQRFNADAPSKLLKLLLPQSPRWRSLRLNLHSNRPEAIITGLLSSIKGQLSLLRALECTSSSRHLHANVFGAVFADTPNLREVRLASAEDPDESIPPTVNLPWDQLTHFRGCYHVLADALCVLRSAPNLYELGLTIDYWNQFDFVRELGAQQIEVLHLRRLSILSTRRSRPLTLSGARNFLRAVTTPALQELWITFSAVVALLQCIERSGSYQLLTLVVYDCAGDVAPRLVPILRVLPTLSTLFMEFLDGRTATRDIFDALTIDPAHSSPSSPRYDSEAVICPALSRVAVGDLTASHANTFLAMIESRFALKADPTLTFVRGYSSLYKYAWSVDANSRVERMRQGGLDIELQSGFRAVWEAGYMREGRP
ncbi:hypothetical protein C8R46DRAFT_1057040 [Mycena filopes]|nr:hypothetical protein C8R46DRAFT_1057040 [Mycena filopes]